jgi:hypothetical protein
MRTWEHYIRDQDTQAELAMLDREARAVVAQALAEPFNASWQRLTQAVYKYTTCGASLYHRDEVAGQVLLSSIIEGVEPTTTVHELNWPFSVKDVQDAIENVEKEAAVIWDNTHGCEACGPEDDFGYRRINPHCPSCAGHGTIL